MGRVYILLGSNLGDRERNLSHARELVCEILKDEIASNITTSSVYESKPWGFESDDCFLNQALAFDTDIEPELLMRICLSIEERMGRIRNMRQADIEGRRLYESRVIDIDIMLYGDKIIDTSILQLPHPRLPEREFALLPMTEIAPNLIHPVLHKSMMQLLEEIRSQS